MVASEVEVVSNRRSASVDDSKQDMAVVDKLVAANYIHEIKGRSWP